MKKKVLAVIIGIGVVCASIGIYFLVMSFFILDRVEFEVSDEKIDDFAYWLDKIDKDEVKNSKYDLFILDYSKDGTEENEFSSKEVKYMKSSGDEEKLLISYLSIGEAEDYRFYWNDTWTQGNPAWLDEENPNWEGNYKVKYWMPEWQVIVFDYLDRILEANFDGIYCDLVDAYWYYEETVANSDWLMMEFVINISDYAKAKAGKDFSIFVQNADELLSNKTYLEKIDGIGREDLFYDDNVPTDDDWREEGIDNLEKALDADKAVLVTDYPTAENNIYDFYSNCIDNGFLAYAAERDLDSLKEYWFYPAT